MKKIKIQNIFFAIMAIVMITFATSCEKIVDNKEVTNNIENLNAKFKQTGDPYDYVFVNPQWELIDENYKDEDGNIGKLFINANNEKEQLLKVELIKKICTDYKGTWATIEMYDPDTRTTIYYQSCQESTVNRNCGVTICVDDVTKKVTVAVYDLKKD